jgi:hypothetical protein
MLIKVERDFLSLLFSNFMVPVVLWQVNLAARSPIKPACTKSEMWIIAEKRDGLGRYGAYCTRMLRRPNRRAGISRSASVPGSGTAV